MVYPVSPEPDYDIAVDDEPLELNFDPDLGNIPDFEGMPDLVDSDDEEDIDDDFQGNGRDLSDLDLPQDDDVEGEELSDGVVTPPVPSPTSSQAAADIPPSHLPNISPSQFTAGRENIENQLRKPVVVQHFKDQFQDSKAGEPIRIHAQSRSKTHQSGSVDSDTNPYAPFVDRINWEIAKWAKLRGPSSTAFSELLNINGVQEALGLSYKNSRELNKIIDEDMPGTLPKFRCKSTPVLGESVDLYYRPILECIKALLGNADFAKELVFSPERHYSDEDCTIRLYHDMHTGKWWWDTQVCIIKNCISQSSINCS